LAKRLLPASLVGLPFGYAVFNHLSERSLRIVLGVGVGLAVGALARGLDLAQLGPRMDWMLGFTSGVLNTAISTSGPPLVFDLQARRLEPAPFRETINYVFFYRGCVGLAIFALGNEIHGEELITGAFSIPALLVGLAVGFPLRNFFPAGRFRKLMLALLLAGAAAAVWKAVA